MCIFNKFKAKKRFTSFSGSKLFIATSYTTKLVKKTIELQRKALFQHSNRAYLISASIRFVINYNNECNNIIVVVLVLYIVIISYLGLFLGGWPLFRQAKRLCVSNCIVVSSDQMTFSKFNLMFFCAQINRFSLFLSLMS